MTPPLALPEGPAVSGKKKRVVRVIREKRFFPAITVKTENGKRFQVPTSPEAAQTQMQLILAKVASVYEFNTQFIIDNQIPMEPKALQDYITAGIKLSELSRAAYEARELPPALGQGGSEVGKLAAQMLGSAMQGAATGMAASMKESLEERMAKIAELGKKTRAAVKVSGEIMHEKAQEANAIPVQEDVKE
jgi:hypothetical protein